MTDEKKGTKSITTLAEDLRKIREARRKFTPEEIKELNKLLEGPTENPADEKNDKKSARPPETEV
jgi:hypothetical protein